MVFLDDDLKKFQMLLLSSFCVSKFQVNFSIVIFPYNLVKYNSDWTN